MILRRSLLCVSASMLLVLAVAAGRGEGVALAPSDYVISGPFTHENLTVFLIHGPDRIQGKIYLTLQEAMAQKKVIVHETGNVNELSIENVSDEDVYIQGGDIVKGGRQDRTLANDLIVSGHSGKVPLNAFCVEAGRWRQRAGEDSVSFASSNMNLATKSLKVAAKNANDQSAVWQEVSIAQHKLSENAAAPVNDPRSATSLQLSLENKKVEEAITAYQKALAGIAQGKADVIGYAFAINGKLNSVDIYVSNALFNKMWEKNLRASSVEAFAEYKKDAKFEPAKVEAVKSCLADAAKGNATSKDVTQRIRLVTRESKDNWQYETYDAKAAAPAHLNILTRDPETERLMQQRRNQPQQRQQLNFQGEGIQQLINAAPTTQPRQQQDAQPARQR